MQRVFDEVLVYCDSRRGGDNAVTTAIDLAKETDAHLHLLYLTQDTGTDQYKSTHSERKVDDVDDLSDARDEIDALVQRAGIGSETHVEVGTPRSDITSFAEQLGVDLIVVGVIDKKLPHIIRNTVAEEVVHSAPMQVLAVDLDEEDIQNIRVYRCMNCDSGFQSTVDDTDYAQCPYCGSEKFQDQTIS